MPPIHSIRVTAEHLPSRAQEYVYSIAGNELVFTREVKRLQAFYVACRDSIIEQAPFIKANFEQLEANYHGTAPFANSLRDVKFYRSGDIAQLNIDDVPACQISLSNNAIHVINDAEFDSEINLELLTGPALILLLAQQNIFCLHAGAISIPPGNIAIIAESGVGKSTLSKHHGDAWGQLADDILPLKGSFLQPDFPQLKLLNATTLEKLGADTRLKALFRIAPNATKDIHFKSLNAIEAMLQVVRHTVASKLFDQKVMSAHVAFAKNLVSEVHVIEISYPRDLSRLDELRQAISNFVSAL